MFRHPCTLVSPETHLTAASWDRWRLITQYGPNYVTADGPQPLPVEQQCRTLEEVWQWWEHKHRTQAPLFMHMDVLLQILSLAWCDMVAHKHPLEQRKRLQERIVEVHVRLQRWTPWGADHNYCRMSAVYLEAFLEQYTQNHLDLFLIMATSVYMVHKVCKAEQLPSPTTLQYIAVIYKPHDLHAMQSAVIIQARQFPLLHEKERETHRTLVQTRHQVQGSETNAAPACVTQR
jgi:hypothetical protein